MSGWLQAIPSGGLLWHWRAWRSQAAWASTRGHIAAWLDTAPPAQALLLLGASAGWMLPSAWLTRFRCIEVWDLDPLARPLFAARHGAALRHAGVVWHYRTGDALTQLPDLLAQQPQALVLMDNLLGQLRFHAGNDEASLNHVEQTLAALRQALQGRCWGSVHDLLSGPGQRSAAEPAMRVRRLKGDASPADDAWLQAVAPQGEWLDHLTGQLFAPGTKVHDIAWPFEPGYWHWLQAAWVQPSASAGQGTPCA